MTENYDLEEPSLIVECYLSVTSLIGGNQCYQENPIYFIGGGKKDCSYLANAICMQIKSFSIISYDS